MINVKYIYNEDIKYIVGLKCLEEHNFVVHSYIIFISVNIAHTYIKSIPNERTLNSLKDATIIKIIFDINREL